MTSVQALYYDGRTAARRTVWLEKGEFGSLRILGDGICLSYPLSDVAVSPRLSGTPRFIDLPDGAQCECPDNESLDKLLSPAQTMRGRWLYRWEASWRYALAAAILTAASVWGAMTYGFPALAERLSYQFPMDSMNQLGMEALRELDRNVFAPSQLSAVRQKELNELFMRLIQTLPGKPNYRLELRSAKTIGANAFALPGGIVVLLDELVEVAENDQEPMAVLAHELGHLEMRHALRQVLQDSASLLLTATIAGDLTSINGLAASLPSSLTQAKYSRDFEREADRYALKLLKAQGVQPLHFINLLNRIEKQRPGAATDFLATHPPTPERVRFFSERP